MNSIGGIMDEKNKEEQGSAEEVTLVMNDRNIFEENLELNKVSTLISDSIEELTVELSASAKTPANNLGDNKSRVFQK